MNDFDKILAELDIEIDEIDLYGYDIIETSLSMVHKLQTVLNDLRTKIQTYVFPTKEDEITFFKTGCSLFKMKRLHPVYYNSLII